MDRGAGPELPRHRLPLTTGAQHVEYPIEDEPRGKPSPSPRRQEFLDRQQPRDPIPPVVRHAPDGRHTPPPPSPPLRHPHLHLVALRRAAVSYSMAGRRSSVESFVG